MFHSLSLRLRQVRLAVSNLTGIFFKYSEKMKAQAGTLPATGKRFAIIGTGPVSLLKAYLLVRQNPANSVVMIDAAGQAGGAWYSDRSPKGHEVECGCHIWSYVPASYRYIRDELGLPLYPMKPNAVFVGTHFHLPYSVKNSVDTYRAFFKILFTFRWKRFKNLYADPNMNFRLIGKKNLYPQTGSPELIHALEKKIGGLQQIKLLLNTDIQSITINDRASIRTTSGDFEFDHLFMTYVSRISDLTIEGKQVDVAVRKVDYIHFVLRLNKPLKKKISYWRMMNDKVVHRITDISYQTGNEENLLLVGIKGAAYENDSEENLFGHVCRLLEKYGLTDSSYETEKIKTHIFPTHYLQDRSIETIKKNTDKITLMHTTDLMHGFYFQLKKEGIA
jgi:hypothetical protein